jgi:hypothetical protein
LVGRDSSETFSNFPSNMGWQGQNPFNFPTAPKIVDPGLGAAANPAGAGGEGGNAEFDYYCPAPKQNNHKNQKLLIMIIVQMTQKRKSNLLNNVN